MKLKNLDSVNLNERTVLYRAPYDIDTKVVNGVLELDDDIRIRATIPTLEYLLKENCRIVILTYVGRPDGKAVEELRTTLHAKRLSELLNHRVDKVDDCVGSLVEEKIAKMKSGDILMLENVRFYNEEMIDDDEFAQKLCKGKDLIVFDGFPQAHRIHASTTGIGRHLPIVAGLYLQHEVEMLSTLLEKPKHPFTVIIGGAKISDKVGAVRNLLGIADVFLIGGAVANIFLKAEGRVLGSSFIEDVFVDKVKRENKDWVEEAKDIFKQADILGKKIICPKDLVISDDISAKVITTEDIPAGWAALDIGPKTQEDFSNIINQSKTVFINGPMGKMGDERFARGSEAIFNAMKNAKKNFSSEIIIAGGDTIDVASKYGSLSDYSDVSLAGGAILEFLAGKDLPALLPIIIK